MLHGSCVDADGLKTKRVYELKVSLVAQGS